ncbi:MAG: hypothetical protein K2X32_07325 [Phycisphaerales bacterium]|nr:hypothetical protein [Phycisphaerales bacterium]
MTNIPPPPPTGPPLHLATDDAPPSFTIIDGEALLMFAVDIGLSIDLDLAQKLLARPGERVQRETLQAATDPRRTPEYFEFRPAPLRVSQTASPVVITPEFSTTGDVRITLFDFGAACIIYRVRLAPAPEALLDLAIGLYEHRALLADARARAGALLGVIESAVRQPRVAEVVEDYIVYHLRSARGYDAAAITTAQRDLLARVLRAERTPLSDQQIDDALSSTLSYTRNDQLIIDWNASILINDPGDDVISVLEYANVELLEVRHMDDRLDEMLEASYEAVIKSERAGSAAAKVTPETAKVKLSLLPRLGRRSDLHRLAVMQMDSALMFEDINNALKLLGDQYLARVYRLAAQRMHLPDWDASVLRKIQTLDGIYQKASDERSDFRMQVLEWIIIVLIAVSIVLPFIAPGK